MVDLVSEGCVPLPAAFDRFRDVLWNGGAPVFELRERILSGSLPAALVGAQIASLDEVTNLELAEFVRPFVEGHLEALARRPTETENVTIASQEWATAFFPERFFLEPEIGLGHGKYWDALVGRTPFVRRAQLDAWLSELRGRAANARGRGVPPVHALRQSMIGLVMDGLLASEEAEALAAEWGMRPFATRPDPARFDPMAQASWSLAMTVAWISMRSADAVRDSWAAYRSECWGWFSCKRLLPTAEVSEPTIVRLMTGVTVHGSALRALGPVSLWQLRVLEALDADTEQKVVSVRTAREDLWRHLMEGSLAASGLNPGGDVVQVPPHEWQYLELAGDLKGTDYVIQRAASLEAAYTDLKFLRKAVTAIWRPTKGTASAAAEAGDAPADLTQADWTLWEAAMWVGCKGQNISAGACVEQGLDDEGAATLFAALAAGGALVASGITQARLREPIPPAYWEMATVDPHRHRERHYVSFIDDVLEGYGGQLTPYGEDKPKWFGIKVKRDLLFEAFPSFAPAGWAEGAAGDRKVGSSRKASRKLNAAMLALAALYPHGVPSGLSRKEQLSAVNEWLRERGHSAITTSTLIRAIEGSRSGQIHPY